MKKIETKYSKNSSGHYSAGVISGNYVFVSGQLSVDPETNKVPEGGIEAETLMSLKNVERVLAEVNLTKDNIIMCHVYIPDIKLWDSVNKVYKEYFGEHRPARVVVPSNSLHGGCLVEIEAIAEIECKLD